MFYGWSVGANSLVQNLSYVYIYFWLFLFYPIIYILVCNNGKKRLIYAICGWTIVALLLKTMVWLLYNYLHKDVMHYLLFEFGSEWIRNGFQRIPATCFSGVLVCGMLYAFYNSTKVQIKILAIVIILFNMWYALTVFASRALHKHPTPNIKANTEVKYRYKVVKTAIFNIPRFNTIKKIIQQAKASCNLIFISKFYFSLLCCL